MRTRVTQQLAEFVAGLDMFYLGTANAEGQPYIQYRGGPPGFLKVLDDQTLGFADFGGNRQYLTVGNLSENPRAFIFLMDYANRRRVKVWGTAKVVEDAPELLERLRDPGYPGQVERAILFTVEAWDLNCSQHIHRRVRPESLERRTIMSNRTTKTGVVYHTVRIDGLDLSYREAGPEEAPAILLLHGFPTSSHMFRNLMPRLADEFRLIAPDYPGFGASSMPPRDQFKYSFDNLADVVEKFTEMVGLKKYALYLQDYGAPIGYRLAVKRPDRVTAIVVQNGNAYDEGLDNDFWKPIKAYWREPENRERREALRPFTKLEATRWQYTHGARDPASISPDNWFHDQYLLDRPGNADLQLDLFLSYGSNPPLYPKWQEYFVKHQPPMLIVWGKNDQIFPPAGAEPYRRHLKTIEYHLLDTGHFALEEEGDRIADLMRAFLRTHVSRQ